MLYEVIVGGRLIVEESIEFGILSKEYQQLIFVGYFVEVGVYSVMGEVWVWCMFVVCVVGCILNLKIVCSQVIGVMIMGMGVVLMEELVVDDCLGYFVNYDMVGYEVLVYVDILKQEVIFLDDIDFIFFLMKVKGVGELGLCGVSVVIVNVVYNVIGIWVWDYFIILDKLFDKLLDVV